MAAAKAINHIQARHWKKEWVVMPGRVLQKP